MGGSVVFVWEV